MARLPSPPDRPAISPGGAPASAAAGVESGQQAASSQFLAAARGWGTDVSRAVQGIAQEQFNAAQQRMNRDAIITVDKGVQAYRQKLADIGDQYVDADFSDPKVQDAYIGDITNARKQIGDSLGVDDNHMAAFDQQTMPMETGAGISMYKLKEAAQKSRILGMANDGTDRLATGLMQNPAGLDAAIKESDKHLQYLSPGLNPQEQEAVVSDRNGRFMSGAVLGYLRTGDIVGAQHVIDNFPPEARLPEGVREQNQQRVYDTQSKVKEWNDGLSTRMHDFVVVNGRYPTPDELKTMYSDQAQQDRDRYSIVEVGDPSGKGTIKRVLDRQTGQLTDAPGAGVEPYKDNTPWWTKTPSGAPPAPVGGGQEAPQSGSGGILKNLWDSFK